MGIFKKISANYKSHKGKKGSYSKVFILSLNSLHNNSYSIPNCLVTCLGRRPDAECASSLMMSSLVADSPMLSYRNQRLTSGSNKNINLIRSLSTVVADTNIPYNSISEIVKIMQ